MDSEKIFESFKKETEKAMKLFFKKNHDYDNLYFKESKTERFSNFIRKFHRLQAFYKADKEMQVDETITDTLRDLAIYSLMEIVKLELDRKDEKDTKQ